MIHSKFYRPAILLAGLFLLTLQAHAQKESSNQRDYLLELSRQHHDPMDSLFESISLTDSEGNSLSRERLSAEQQTMLFGAALGVKSYFAVEKGENVSDIDVGCTYGHGIIECHIDEHFCALGVTDHFIAFCSTCGVSGWPECMPPDFFD